MRTTRRNFSAVVKAADPDYDKDKRNTIEYDFRDIGGTVFRGNPYKRGVLTPDPD